MEAPETSVSSGFPVEERKEMPNYPYRCPSSSCVTTWEVVKPLSDIERKEECPICGATGSRYIGRTHFYGASDWDKAEYNPGLGCITKNAKHRKQICKARGIEELGNDYQSPEKLHEHNDKMRHEKWERSWAEV